MTRLRDMPVRRKLTLAFALVTGGALLLATLVLVAADLQRLRRDAENQLRAEAALIGANSSAAIAFRDGAAAAETLETLRAIPDVTGAVLHDREGDVLARYTRDGGEEVVDSGLGHTHFDHGHLAVAHDVELDGRRIGSVVLHSDLRTAYAGLREDVLATVGIAVLAFAIALVVAMRLQRLISVPILRLVALAQRVSREADYSLRADVEGRDEIGRLAQGVNEMLETVQHRDRELEDHRRRLETEVAERTTDLERTNERLSAELEERARAEARLTRAHAELERHHRETELLGEMNDRLQVCREVAELRPVVSLYGARLFPGAAGSVHAFDEGRAWLEPLVCWGEGGDDSAFAQEDCWALRRGRVHAVPDPDAALVCPHVGDAAPAGGYVCVPLLAQGNVLGLLHLRFAAASGAGETDPPVAELESMAVSAAERIALAMSSLRLNQRLREQSVRDALTGLHNRRYMEESLERELARAVRTLDPLAVVMIDLDHFKRFNDAHGHDAGDALLRAFGAVLHESVRAEDVACRYGGEEFTLILPHADADVARRRLEELLARVRALDIDHRGRHLDGITICAGVAVFPEHGDTSGALLRAADEALYAAKAAGRDRVEVCSREDVPAS